MAEARAQGAPAAQGAPTAPLTPPPTSSTSPSNTSKLASTPMTSASAEMREAAYRLARIARFLADIRRLRWLDRSAIPTDPAWERTVNNAVLLSAVSRVYRSVGAGTDKALAPREQLAQYRRDFELVVPTVFRRA